MSFSTITVSRVIMALWNRPSFQAMRTYNDEPIVVQREVKAVAIGVEVNLKLGSVGGFRTMA